MRLKKWLEEEITTSTVGNLDTDSASSNKMVRVKSTDEVNKLIKDLKKRGAKVKKEKDGSVTLDLPYETPKHIMKRLSKFSI